MAPKKQARTSGAGQKLDTARSDSTSVDASQELDPGKVQDVINRHNERAKERRKKRKAEIVSSHKTRVEKLHVDIKHCLQKHHERVRAIRRPKVDRLIELAHEKRALQDRIDMCQSDLEKAFESTARQLQIALDGRIDEMSA